MGESDGGPAFPEVELDQEPLTGMKFVKRWQAGMSLRDYFAGQALVGLVLKCQEAGDAVGSAVGISEDAYILAEAMLAEREK